MEDNIMSFREHQKTAIKSLVEQVGEQGAVRIIGELLEEKKMIPEDFSIKEIWEAVSSDIFPTITGQLINKKVIDAYNLYPTIGDQLVTTVPSNMEVERIVGLTDVDGVERVLEGAAYNDTELGEKYVTIVNQKFGRTISITEEAIMFDRTNQLLQRAQMIGEKAAYEKEKMIVQKAIDVNSDAYSVSGVPGVLYRSTASGLHKVNLSTSSPFGEAGLEAVYKLMHTMTDDNGDYTGINTANLILLVPQDLMVEAMQMQKSTLVPEGTENAVNTFQGAFRAVLTSQWITANNSTTWYLGDFKRNLWWTEVWPIQTMTLAQGSYDEFKRDIKAQYKVRFFGGCGAIDHKHVYKCTA